MSSDCEAIRRSRRRIRNRSAPAMRGVCSGSSGLCPTKREWNTKSTNQSTKSTKNAEYEVLFVLFVSALCLLCSVPFPVGQSRELWEEGSIPPEPLCKAAQRLRL